MSKFLWASARVGATVQADVAGRRALYKYRRKLDALSRRGASPHFLALCAGADPRAPDASASAAQGWIGAAQARDALAHLLERIKTEQIRFGVATNERQRVVRELEQLLRFARVASVAGAQLTLSIVA